MRFVRPRDPPEAISEMARVVRAGGKRLDLNFLIDTQVIRIPIVYRDFDDFWEFNTVLIGPQGKIISGMSTSEREKLRTDLRNRLPTASDGRIVYELFANAVKGRVRG